MKRRILLGGLAAATLPAPAIGQARYPDRNIRLVIPFPPGGPTDIIGRMTAERLTSVLGQTVVVDNKAGAAGSIGANDVKAARPDGYTFLFATSSTHAINPTAFTKPPYDPVKDFTPISSICINPLVLVASMAMPDTLKGLVELMRKEPNKYSYGSSGTGGITHLAGEYLKATIGGMNVEHVPYRGSNPALQDLMGGSIAWMFETMSTSLQLHRTGKARILGFAHANRTPAALDIPTMIEAGAPGYEAYTFNLVLGPAGTPAPIVDTIHRATRTIMGDKSFIEGLEKIAAVPIVDTSPAGTAKFIADELAKWGPVIRASGVKIE